MTNLKASDRYNHHLQKDASLVSEDQTPDDHEEKEDCELEPEPSPLRFFGKKRKDY